MADEVENDDQWLYGDTPDLPNIDNEKIEEEAEEEEEEERAATPNNDEEQDKPEEPEIENEITNKENTEETTESNEPLEKDEEDDEKQNDDGSDKEDSDDDDDDDSDDDVNVVIGDIKTSPSYTSLNIKRSGILTSAGGTDKQKSTQPQSGKFSIEEFDQIGNINGVPASEFNLDSLEEKPWRKPGADITDYFNYGFNEDTWRAYCERQKRLRINESGVGLAPMTAIGMPRGPVPIMNDNSKYSGNFIGARKAGPPPGRRMTGSIDVIGGAQQRVGGVTSKVEAPKENVIQVMTADRREYSRKPPGFPDMSMPPPSTFEEFPQDYTFNPEPDPYFGGYEPTQDSQWGPEGHPPWPQDIKPITPAPGPIIPASTTPTAVPPPINMGPPNNNNSTQQMAPSKESPPMRRDGRDEREREREMSRSRSEKSRDRERERSHRRERSRSRSRRHKSRSRSPSHRSHRKKKSRRHDDSD